MSNLIPFQTRSSGHGHEVAAAFLQDPAPRSHAVQFYESEDYLAQTVSQFLAAGLTAGDRILVVATQAHADAFMIELGEGRESKKSLGDVARRAVDDGRLVFLDARETLSKFLISDMPDPDLFRDVLARAIHKVQGNSAGRLRVYGEMVNLLWQDGNSRAAVRLEELWNDAGRDHAFSLLCAYTMGNFYKEGDAGHFMEVCRTHSHVIPTEDFTQLDDPHARLREISLLQQRARALESEIQHRKQLEAALRDALRERGRVEEELRECVKRETQAREQAETSDSFKEMFLSILGHDLRNPLNTVLTTVRLMKHRGDLPVETASRLDRVVSSGVRMERMIQQLLDVARARLTEGIPVVRTAERDLVPLVAKIIDELQAVYPTRRIGLQSAGPCVAEVDADRLEQVISNLVGNALVHGDPQKPIAVAVMAREGLASIAVHNFGPPIDAVIMPMLFDPFRRGRHAKARGATDGLGLGLYIADQVIRAHGGKIEVESSAEAGTLFEVIFPRAACSNPPRS